MKLIVRGRGSLFEPRAGQASRAIASSKPESGPPLSRPYSSPNRTRPADPLQSTASRTLGVLNSLLAHVVVAFSYLGTLAVCHVTRIVPRPRWTPTGRLAITATFFNTQWFFSHVVPLTRTGVETVIVVADRPLATLQKVRFWCPPRWMSRFAGRAVSKLACLLACGLYLKPDVFVGFHLFPGAISALIVARLLGRPACYQMTGGPIEIVGGGTSSENRLLAKLGRASPLLESLAIAVARQFDLVVVRGSKARSFLMDRGIGRVTVITGSVTTPSELPAHDREYDLVFVGRLVAIKQPLQFVEIVASLQRQLPLVRAAVVGEGPLLDAARERAAALRIEQSIDFFGHIQDVHQILARVKVFALTSRSEGLSIAMVEAMAAGAVPVVANVGDLGDLVADGATGFLVTPDNIPEFTRRIALLLQNQELWTRHSRAAAAAARRHTSVEVVTAKWTLTLTNLVSGYRHRPGDAEGDR